MKRNDKRNLTESCVLIAEVDGYNYYYNVAVPDIDYGIKTIKATFNYFNQDCSKVYISGFTLVSDGTNLSKEELVKKISTSRNWFKTNDSQSHSLK